MLGIVACAMSATAGARRIVAVDTNTDRLNMARQFGADDVVRASVLLQREVDIVLEFSGAPAAMETTLGWLAIGGRALWVGATFPPQPLRLDAERIVRRLLTVKGLHNYNQRDLLAAVTFIERHHRQYPFHRLIHEGFDLSEVNQAFAFALETDAYRVGVRLDGQGHGGGALA